jgi:predicted protein tyrosine phosphatase
MPWIENVSKGDAAKAHHFDPGPNSVLICINDINCEWVIPKFPFKEVHKFEFLDVEDTDTWCPEEAKFSEPQAKEIIKILSLALRSRSNVVVHCTAGICRSGAVVEVATMMGFDDTEKWRSPNLRVKHMLMQELGLIYDPNEQHRVKNEIYPNE